MYHRQENNAKEHLPKRFSSSQKSDPDIDRGVGDVERIAGMREGAGGDEFGSPDISGPG